MDESEEDDEEATLLSVERVEEENIDLNSGTAEMIEASWTGGRNPTKARQHRNQFLGFRLSVPNEKKLTSEVWFDAHANFGFGVRIYKFLVFAFLFRFLFFELSFQRQSSVSVDNSKDES